eukprot:1544520-Prymnesium_polylepis.1
MYVSRWRRLCGPCTAHPWARRNWRRGGVRTSRAPCACSQIQEDDARSRDPMPVGRGPEHRAQPAAAPGARASPPVAVAPAAAHVE